MARRTILQQSKMVSDRVKFVWKISDFSVEYLLEEAIKSPMFKCFNTDFHLELSYCSQESDQIRLRLVQIDSDDFPRITTCSIGFYCPSSSTQWYGNNLTRSGKKRDIARDLSVDAVKECLADKVLTVGCILTVSKLKHTLSAQSETKMTGKETAFLKQGHVILTEKFGNILKDSKFFDVTLKVGDETIPAHKAILAGRSSVFEGMFESNLKESRENVVEIAEITPAIVKEMLKYIYTGTVENLSVDAAVDLYVAADRYDLQELKGWCKEFILEHISSDDVCRVAVVADLHSDEELDKASRRIFKENTKTIVKSEAWGDFKKENPSLHTDLLESALINDY